MPILPKKIENRLPISTDILINDIALTITRCTFQEYKIKYNITSDEFDDLDKGYECVYNPYHIIFIPDIMAIDMFDLQGADAPLLTTPSSLLGFAKFY